MNPINIYVNCKNLVDLDVMGKSDPFCVLLIKTEKEPSWMNLGQSEVLWNDLDPSFSKVWVANYFFEKKQILRAEIYDHDEEESQLIGFYEVPLNKLLTDKKQTINGVLMMPQNED